MAPNERWHSGLMYLRVEDTWYFLVTVPDAYSRYVVHWDLLTEHVPVHLTHSAQAAGGAVYHH